MIFPLKVLASYRHLLFLKEKRKKEGQLQLQLQKENLMMGLQSQPLTPGTGTSCSQEMLYVNQVEHALGKAVTSHLQS